MLAYKYLNHYKTPEEQKIATQLSQYTEQYIAKDGKIVRKTTYDPRFLKSSNWTFAMFTDIEQFNNAKPAKYYCKCFDFACCGETIGLEMRFIFYHNIFNQKWSVRSVFSNHPSYLNRVFSFLKEHHPKLKTLLALNIQKVSDEWVNWLKLQGTAVTLSMEKQETNIVRYGKPYVTKN